MILPFTANALSATTAKTIKGTEPAFKAVSGENRLGFTVGGKFYSESSVDSDENNTGNIVSGTSKKFDNDLTFNDFVITPPAFTVSDDYDDSDGDIAHLTAPFTMGALTYKWIDNNGTSITGTNLSKMIGCGSGYSMPLKLEITLVDVQVHSEFGDPRDSTLTKLTKTYQIDSTAGICSAKPNQMAVLPTQTWRSWNGSTFSWNGSSTRDIVRGGGYSADFDPNWGFKTSANPKFPTTGFPGAQFQLVMTGTQTDWTYSVSATPANSVRVVNTASGNEKVGDVILVSKPSSSVTVTAKLKSDSSVTYNYTFNPTTNGWFVPKPSPPFYLPHEACGDESKLPTAADLTNSPQNTAEFDWTEIDNSYTRSIGQGLFSEWGWTDGNTYRFSKWYDVDYWVQGEHEGLTRYRVYVGWGAVGTWGNYDRLGAVCRG